ncbi:CCHC-type domain-containing protein [Citrus sinensis]|nr:CCHC-type domain-containing protein [Citrus sinensis]
MDTEELVRKCSAITLQEEENDKITLLGSMKEKGLKLAANYLVGKVVLNKGINTEGLRAVLQQMWRTIKEFKKKKKKVFTGGPWHFAGTLIVMKKPKGIGDVNNQQFTHASFWVQIYNVPLMCMHKGAIQKLGKKIGDVEEIETDDDGECIGLYARLRISVNVTRPLKKILFIEEEDKKKIPMAMVYERLPDFYFCCGILGHQYREYRGQPKDKFPYGSWLKAKTAVERAKLNKDKWGWSKEHHKPNSPPATLANQPGLRQTLTSSNAQANIADTMDSTRTLCKKEGKNGGKETEVENERGNFVEWITKKPMQAQKENDKEEYINGLRDVALKPKRKKWKSKARNATSGEESTTEVLVTKRPRTESGNLSPEKKRSKLTSPCQLLTNKPQSYSLAVKTTLNLENLEEVVSEDAVEMQEDVSAVAGEQPRREP